MRPIIPVLALTVLAALAPAAFATKIRVPQDHATIQAAVDAAESGDVIVIRGTHVENVLIENKSDLVIRGVRGAVIDGSLENGRTNEGIEVDACQRITIRGLIVRDTANDMIRVHDSSDIVIDRCTVIAGEMHDSDGISVSRCQNVVVSRCRIRGADSTGIYLNGDACVLRRNRIEATRSVGIQVTPSSTNCLLEKNRVRDSRRSSIVLNGDRNIVRANVCSGTEASGIEVVGGSHEILDNRISDSFADGISVQSSDCVVRGNRVKRSGGDGVLVASDGNTLETNVVRRAFGAGFNVAGTLNVLRRNKARASGTFDLVDLTPANGNTYEGNDFPSEQVVH